LGEDFTRVSTPHGADPFLSLPIETGLPIMGRTFRVSLELRANKPIPVLGCRGLWLQEFGRGFASACLPVAVNANWQRFTLMWTAPRVVGSPSALRVVLNDFDGLEYDLRGLRLEERALSPSGSVIWVSLLKPWVGLDWPGHPATGPDRMVLSDKSGWLSSSIEFQSEKQEKDFEVRASLWSGDSRVEIRNTNLVGIAGSASPIPKSLFERVNLWYPSPNSLAHVVVTVGLSAMVLTQSSWLAFFAAVVSVVTVLPTGSRTAWLALLIGIPWALWLASAKDIKRWVFIVGILGLALASGGLNRFSFIQFSTKLEDGNPLSRPEIWSGAWRAILEHPLGLGSQGFSQWFERHHPNGAGSIYHAHNFWLELGVRYGWVGFCSAVVLTLGLVWFAWCRGRYRGLALVFPVLLMNFFDFTLLYPGVSYSLYLCLNAVKTTQGTTSDSLQ
jgi:O-Antigen ligase